ncbi:hypothetical protein M3Y96_00319900 [Aphelenchoides besseyi]|nr:hypothetical protein M3Y96_00319900 [Aphelenchoides besseyi]
MDVKISDMPDFSFSNCSTFSVDGRFFFGIDCNPPYMIDLFHCKYKNLSFDFSNAKCEWLPSKKGPPVVHKAFGLNLSTILLNYTLPFDMNEYWAVAEIDLERSVIAIEKSILVPLDLINYSREWIPCNFPPNLNDGMILWKYGSEASYYLKLKMQSNGQLQWAKSGNLPDDMRVIGCFDNYIYGLVKVGLTENSDVEPSLNLIKLSILTGEQIEQKTLDWELLYEPVNPIDCSIWFGCGSNAFLMLNPSIVAPLVRAEAVNSRDCVLTYLFYRC